LDFLQPVQVALLYAFFAEIYNSVAEAYRSCTNLLNFSERSKNIFSIFISGSLIKKRAGALNASPLMCSQSMEDTD